MQTSVMTGPWLAALAALWLSAIGLSVVDIHQIDRQRHEERQATWGPLEDSDVTQEADQPVVEPALAPSPSVLLMPTATIVARPGSAEMQGRAADPGARPDDLTIGPGIVTHPVAIPHDPTPPPAR